MSSWLVVMMWAFSCVLPAFGVVLRLSGRRISAGGWVFLLAQSLWFVFLAVWMTVAWCQQN